MRKLILLTFAAILVIVGLVANALVAQRRQTPAIPPSPAAGHGQRMANIDLAGLTAAEIADRITLAAGDGHRWIRLRLPWDEIEPEAGLWQWQGLDSALDAARSADVNILLLLDGSPAWARAAADADNPLAPPHDVRDFGHFTQEVAKRVQGQVRFYQIWDEPNIAPHWGARWVDAQAYTQLLREAALSIRQVDPDSAIILATLAPTTARDGANLSDLDYLRQLYQKGAAAWFDAIGANAYGFDLSPSTEPAPDQLNFRRPELLRQIMVAQGDGDKAVWITAWGWWTAVEGGIADSPWGRVSLQQRAGYVQTGWNWVQERWPWAGAMAWAEYMLNPTDNPLRQGFVQRNAAGQLTQLGNSLNALEPAQVAGIGSWPVTTFLINYALAQWRLSPLAADPAGESAELTLRWQGEALALRLQRGPYWGVIRVWIDGKPAAALPKDKEGNAYLLLYDPENKVATVPLLRKAEPGIHELRLQVSGGWGQWPLRNFIILDQPWPRPWPFWPLTGLLLAILLVISWQWWRQWQCADGQRFLFMIDQIWNYTSARYRRWHPLWHYPLALILLLAFYFAPGLGLSLLAGIGLALLLSLRLEITPFLVLLALPFYTRPKILGPIGLPLHELLIWLAMALAVFRCGIHESHPARPASFALRQTFRRLDWPVFGLLLIGALATLGAQHFGFALYDWRITLLTPILFYFFITRLHPSQPLSLIPLADALVLSALVLSLLGLRQWWLGQAIFVEGVPRISALYGSPNNLALYLGRIWPLLLMITFLGFDGSTQKSLSWRRGLYAFTFIITSVVAFLTFSKGLLLISMPTALLLLALLEKRLRWPVVALFILGTLALLPFLGTERFRDLFNTGGGTTFLRLQLWQSAWQMWLDHPLFGVGSDNFLYAYRSFYALPSAWEELNLSHPHNLMLDLLTRLGVFGFVAGMWMLGQTIFLGAQQRQRAWKQHPPSRRIWGGLLVGFVAGMAHGLIDNSIFLADLSILSFLVVALAQRQARPEAAP